MDAWKFIYKMLLIVDANVSNVSAKTFFPKVNAHLCIVHLD